MSEEKKFELNPSLAILIAGALIAGAVVFTNYTPSAALEGAAQQQAAAASVPAPSADDHVFGSPTAPTVLIEYSDFECPFCARAHPTLKRIVEESNGQIAWVYRHLPLESIHAQARPAALASECIAEQLGNDGFWKFTEAIFADQSKMSTARYEQLAGQFGADVAAYKACVASGKYDNHIDKETQEAFSTGANGTPFTVIHTGGPGRTGKQSAVYGAVPYEQFKQAIESVR